MNPLGMIIDGWATTNALDSSGELLAVEDCDITDLSESGLFNYEHLQPKDVGGDKKGHVGEDKVGKVLYARRLLKESDCETDRQKKYWKDLKGLKGVYVVGRIWDVAGHAGAKALAASIRDQHAHDQKILLRCSVEGSTLERSGQVLEATVARNIALTYSPCNRTCDIGLLADPGAPDGFEKWPVSEDEVEKILALCKTEVRHVTLRKKVRALLEKTLTAGCPSGAPGQLQGGAALQREHPLARKAARVIAAYRAPFEKSEFRRVLKYNLPEVDEKFLDHFADLAEDFHVKRGIIRKAQAQVDEAGRLLDLAKGNADWWRRHGIEEETGKVKPLDRQDMQGNVYARRERYANSVGLTGYEADPITDMRGNFPKPRRNEVPFDDQIPFSHELGHATMVPTGGAWGPHARELSAQRYVNSPRAGWSEDQEQQARYLEHKIDRRAGLHPHEHGDDFRADGALVGKPFAFDIINGKKRPVRDREQEDLKTEARQHLGRFDLGATFNRRGQVVEPRGVDARINARAAGAAELPPMRRSKPAPIPEPKVKKSERTTYNCSWPDRFHERPVDDLFPTEEIVDEDKVQDLMNAMATGRHIPPIMADDEGRVSDGHHRLEAAKRLGLQTVPVRGSSPRKRRPGKYGIMPAFPVYDDEDDMEKSEPRYTPAMGPMTVRGEPLRPNPHLATPYLDEQTGVLHTRGGSLSAVSVGVTGALARAMQGDLFGLAVQGWQRPRAALAQGLPLQPLVKVASRLPDWIDGTAARRYADRLVDVAARHRGDIRSASREAGMVIRYSYALLGATSGLLEDKQVLAHLFGLDQEVDRQTVGAVCDAVAESDVSDALDRWFAARHPAVRLLRGSRWAGAFASDEDAVLPAQFLLRLALRPLQVADPYVGTGGGPDAAVMQQVAWRREHGASAAVGLFFAYSVPALLRGADPAQGIPPGYGSLYGQDAVDG